MVKKIFALLTVFLVGVLMSSIAQAAITIDEVKIDGDTISASSSNSLFDVERGDELEVKVRITGDTTTHQDVQIEAALRGFDSSETIDDITEVFDVKPGVTYVKKLYIPLRNKLDQDTYKLRLRVEDRDSSTVSETYELEVDVDEHNVEVRDVVLSPNTEVKAGRALLSTVRLRNRGENDEEGVKVVVSIPQLGVSAADFVDQLDKEDDNDDEATTEEMFLRIPDNAQTGEYTVRVEVFFDDGDKRNVKETTIFVLGQGEAKTQEKTVIAVGADSNSVQQGGAEVAYPLTITNAGSESKTYLVSADGAAWANFRVEPSNVAVVKAGESKTFTVYASAGKNAPVGEQTFTATVSTADKVLKQLPLKMSVGAAGGAAQLKKGLEVGLVVLVILLVIIGLIVGFSKLRGDDDSEDEKTYY